MGEGTIIFYCEAKIKDHKFLLEAWLIIKHWQINLDNWGDCDALTKLYTKILELNPQPVLSQIRKWNVSNKLWDRRQSLVSLLYFSRTKKYDPSEKMRLKNIRKKIRSYKKQRN